MEGDLHSDFKENFSAKLADWYRKKLLKVHQGRNSTLTVKIVSTVNYNTYISESPLYQMEGDLHSDFKENFFAKLADWYRKKLLKVQQGRKTEGREKAIDMHTEEPQEWLFEVARTYRHVRYHLWFVFFFHIILANKLMSCLVFGSHLMILVQFLQLYMQSQSDNVHQK